MHFSKIRQYKLLVLIIFFSLTAQVSAQELYPIQLSNVPWHGQQRQLRYQPQGTDFVITNGNRLFTRALYGTNTAFRVETGDRPEFALYMPGMGGNIKLGIQSGQTSKWLTEAKTITASYRAGAMLYTIEDPLLANGKLFLEVLAMADAEGVIIKAEFKEVNQPITLYWAFGGANGKKFSRDGDLGTDPESIFYLKPEYCVDNEYKIEKETFFLKYGPKLPTKKESNINADLITATLADSEKTLIGTFPSHSLLKIGDATQLSSPQAFFQSLPDQAPALAGQLNIANQTAYYFTIHRPTDKQVFTNADAPLIFKKAETHRQKLANRILIKTPDAFINTIGGALAMASDATWENPSYLHGAIGWRMRLNGWRGAYTADVLGWHDRARKHLESYLQSQVTSPASGPIIPDTATHLSRSLEKLGVGMFTSGYISRDPEGKNLRAHHYDMNLVFIDILLRHYNWTGDMAFLKQSWSALKRHLEWETRNFDPDRDGLYDAYAAIWASDALQYSGGGVAHSSAYNYFAYAKAAEIAVLLGEDPSPFKNEAQKILKAMHNLLWMKDKGSFAEFKDAMGNRLLHPSAALWTIYHSMDSETMDPFEAYQSLRYVDNEVPHIPIKAKGLEDEGYYTLSTTNWMPYEWSLNNVALAESMHTALANWQGGRIDEAFKLFKSEVLASMYMGGSPGGIVQISHYDAVRGEAYRDFGDPVGVFSRAMVEGLFGITPDALHQTLHIKPGFPSTWNYASFSTPDISFDFKRNKNTDTYTLIPNLKQSLKLVLKVIAQGQVKSIAVNGKLVEWKNLDFAVGKPIIEITAAASAKYIIHIVWEGNTPVLPAAQRTHEFGSVISEKIFGAKVLKLHDPQQVLADSKITDSGFLAKIIAQTGNYTVFAQLKQGALIWWMPICFKVEKTLTLIGSTSKETNSSRFRLHNNSKADVNVSLKVNSFQMPLHIPAGQTSEECVVPDSSLVTGTNEIQIKFKNGKIQSERIYNWLATTKGKLENVDMRNFFNDNVSQIFKNKYLSPRPVATTLQLPWQGIGDWPHPTVSFTVDDSGLRKLAGQNNIIGLPQGITFSSPSKEGQKNIVYTSQWDNYPKEFTMPLEGNSSHAWLLMAGSTNPMQSRLDNGVIIFTYTNGTTDTLALRNPETWWPIEQDYYTDDFAFALQQPRPIRIHLKTGNIVSGTDSKAKYNGKRIEGGAATVLDVPLNPTKTLKSVSLKTLANDVVIGLMGLTLLRE